YGGFLPGLLTLVALGTYSVFVGLRHQMPVRAFEAKEAAAALWEAKWELLLPVVLIGSMVAGVLRIHEAAAFTAVYVLMIEVFVYRDIALRRLPQVIRDSMTLVGAIMLILATAIGFTAFLVQAEVPQKLLESMEVMVKDPFTFLLALNVFLILVGMLMDIFSAIVVVVPLVVPIANYFGIDPYHLGIVFLLNLEIGYLTPPVGLNLFIASFRFEKPVTLLYRAVLPFIALLLVALALTTYGEAYLWNAGEGTVCTSDAECEEGLFGQICSLDPPTEENTERVRRCQRRGVVTALMSLHEGEEIFEFEPAVGGPAAKTEEETASSTEESSESLDELFQEFEDESDPAEGESLDDILRELESDFSTP
ncbi:MAG: TRAP transporter large permease subunit, partial [Myxococcota bacterium]